MRSAFLLFILNAFIFLSCNKSVIDFEDQFLFPSDTTASNSGTHIHLSHPAPKSIFQCNNYYFDSSYYYIEYFEYFPYSSTLYHVSTPGNTIADFSYKPNCIELTNAYGNKTVYAYINEQRVDSIIGFAEPINFFYDDEGYLVKIINYYIVADLFYKNGNLDSTFVRYLHDDYISHFITKYEYYDSIFIDNNSNFFPFYGYDNAAGNQHTTREFGYCDIFGKKNKNLLKARKVSGSGNYNNYYLWEIKNNRIETLYIRDDTSTRRKYIYQY